MEENGDISPAGYPAGSRVDGILYKRGIYAGAFPGVAPVAG